MVAVLQVKYICIDGLVAMTAAFQAANPGSNPGRCIIFSISETSLSFFFAKVI